MCGCSSSRSRLRQVPGEQHCAGDKGELQGSGDAGKSNESGLDKEVCGSIARVEYAVGTCASRSLSQPRLRQVSGEERGTGDEDLMQGCDGPDAGESQPDEGNAGGDVQNGLDKVW